MVPNKIILNLTERQFFCKLFGIGVMHPRAREGVRAIVHK